jgi:hypothetical protein
MGDVISDQVEYFIYGGKFKEHTNLYKNRETYINYAYEMAKTDSDGYMTVTAKGAE